MAFPPVGAEYTRAEVAINQNDSINTLFGYWLTLHELGHTLGLKHDDALHGSAYNSDMTILSYNVPGAGYNTATGEWDTIGNGRFAVSPMPYDLLAIEKAYGSAGSINYESSTYKFIADATNIAPGYFVGTARAWTAVDTGGTDTFDLSGYTTGGVRLDLREAIGPDDAQGNSEWLDHKSIIGQEYVYIARGTEIEIAKGTEQDDKIIGGTLTYSMEGGGGDDVIISAHNSVNGDGAYHMRGGAGDDVLWSTADDRLYGGADSDTYWLNNAKAFDGFNSGTNTFYVYGGQNNSITLAESLSDPYNTVQDTVKVFPGARASIIGAGDNDVLMMGNTVFSGVFYRNDAIWGSSEGVVAGSWRLKFSAGTLTISDLAGSTTASILMRAETQPGGGVDYKAFGITIKGAQYGTSSTPGAMTAPSEKPTFLNEFNIKPILPAPTATSVQGSAFDDALQDQPGSQTFSLYGGVDMVIVKAAASVEIDTVVDFAPIMGEKIDVSAYGPNQTLAISQTGADASFTVGNRTVLMKNVNANDNLPPLHEICTKNAA